jgi:glutaconyl-CoA/methylmalonyl-CoA decarboxylase subunit delta
MTDNIINSIGDTIASAATSHIDDSCIFTDNDPYGALMAIIGMGIVFTILLLLFFVFSNTPKLYTADFKGKLAALFSSGRKQKVIVDQQEKPGIKPSDLSGEVNAAIAAAIFLYRSELHDYENTVLTINKVSRTYSPWSSKIYGLRPVLKK